MFNIKDAVCVRYAVVGAGNIAQTAVLPAFRHSNNSKLVAVISGDAAKRAELRELYDLELDGDYSELESILDRGNIDAVYICTPNSEHKDLAFRAAEQRVHVLCEKPLAPTANDCREMGAACDAAGVKLMVAYRLHFEAATLDALQIVRSGELGLPKLFSSVFTHVVRPGDIRTDPGVAGGVTYDLGVYCVNMARNVFDAEPIRVTARSIVYQGADDTMNVILEFPRDRMAQFCVSNSASSVSSYRIVGPDGDLRVEPGYEYAEGLTHYLTLGEKTKRNAYAKSDQFAPELSYFSRCILDNDDPEPNAEEAWCDLRVIEAILESARSEGPVELPPYQRRRRPTLDQEDREPPITKPRTVHAPSPSLK